MNVVVEVVLVHKWSCRVLQVVLEILEVVLEVILEVAFLPI